MHTHAPAQDAIQARPVVVARTPLRSHTHSTFCATHKTPRVLLAPHRVQVIEFESVAVVLGNLGIRISLVAYPVVCVQKTFLDDVKEQLKHNPEFRGILT
jgi:hypothetical protein